MVIMGIWHYVHKQRYMFELHNKVSSEYLKDLTANPNISRVPGIGFLYSELVQGIPPIFPHFLSNIPSIHSVLVFVSIKSIPISKVAIEERYLFRQVEPREYRMFRCVVRYGYKDVMEEPKEFEHLLIEHLKEFVRLEHFFLESAPTNQTAPQLLEAASTVEAKETRPRGSGQTTIHVEESLQQYNPPALSGPIHQGIASQSTNSSSRIISGPIQGADEEVQFIQKALENGVVYLLGETEVVAEPNASVFKKMVVNYAYNFLRRNFRQGDKIMSIPRSRLLRVGMTYEI